MHGSRRVIRVGCCIAGLLAAATGPLVAQTPRGFGECVPVSQRGSRDVGCFILTEKPIGEPGPSPLFWHVVAMPVGRAAPPASAGRTGPETVITAFGRRWLVAIRDSAWRSHVGPDVATIGPLPTHPDAHYTALYMEASMRPGMKSAIHRHSGPEAWYTFAGETCLETPTGTIVGRAGGRPVIVPGGPPMQLTATGADVRKSIVLILHDASKPATTMERRWKPRGLCRATRQ